MADKGISTVLIAGAGPAGTSAAIRLAQIGIRVILIEREKFPRQKLCGEFITPECLAQFKQLGVLDEMLSQGGSRISETVFYEPGGRSVSVPSEWFGAGERTALGLSRAKMDQILLSQAERLGVKVLAETSVNALLKENGGAIGIRAKNKNGEAHEILADLVIDATGRAGILAKDASGEKRQKPAYIGFKAHLSNVPVEKSRCEIYFFRGGYGGLLRVEGGVSNHCFLIKADVAREFGGNIDRILEEIVYKNARAFEMMGKSAPVFDWLAVAIDGFGKKELSPVPNLVSLGDAGAFIDPFTGSGMLMALESGEILAEALRDSSTAEQTVNIYKCRHLGRFQKRLLACKTLRWAAFRPELARVAISAFGLSRFPRQYLARVTRSGQAT